MKSLLKEWGWAVLVAIPLAAGAYLFTLPKHHHAVATKAPAKPR